LYNIILQLAGRDERLVKLRVKVKKHMDIFRLMDESQNYQSHTRLPIPSFEEWKTKFMTLLEGVDGMDHVKKFEDIAPAFDGATWENKKDKGYKNKKDKGYKRRRNDALGKLACDTLKHFSNECELGGEVCGARLSDYHPVCWSAFDLGHQHPELKSDNPSSIAIDKGIMALVNELMDEDDVGGGLLPVCPNHHDHGEKRKYPLDTIKRLRLLSRPKAERTEHRTIKDVFADPKSRFMYSLYIIDYYARGSHNETVVIRQSTKRVMDLAYVDELTDDFELFPADHYNTHPSVQPHIEMHQKMMRLHKHESMVCASATAVIREGSDEYVCHDNDYCFRNIPAFGYYGIDNDHENQDEKNAKTSKLVSANIITLLNELGLTKATTKYSHKARTRQQNKGVKGFCYYLD